MKWRSPAVDSFDGRRKIERVTIRIESASASEEKNSICWWKFLCFKETKSDRESKRDKVSVGRLVKHWTAQAG